MKLPKTETRRKETNYEINYNIKELHNPDIVKEYRTEVETSMPEKWKKVQHSGREMQIYKRTLNSCCGASGGIRRA